MDYRTAVPMLKTARTAWASESRAETYLAALVGAVGLFLVAREAWQFWTIWTGKD
jgi:hypothetical protein